MRKIEIPNYGTITIKNIIFDINGTLQFKGLIDAEIIYKIQDLKEYYNVFLLSADTRGNLKDLATKLDVDYIKINPADITEAEAKNNELLRLGKSHTVAIGNGNNDSLMLKNALLGLVIIGSEGATIKSILSSDVAFPNPESAIDFLLDEKIMIGTLRS